MPEAAARAWDEPQEQAAYERRAPRPRLVEAPPPVTPRTTAAPARRTVTITGQAAPPRRRPAPRPHERVGSRPDRIALWAVVMCLFLILVAAMSANAATPVHRGHAAPGALVSR
jgi:hypothetical protein